MVWQHRFAVYSGVLGATASCVAKIALSPVVKDASNSSQLVPFQWLHDECSRRFQDQDFDAWIVRKINLFLGELMVKYGIVLMGKWKRLMHSIEDVSVSLYIFEVEWCTALAILPRVTCLLLVVLFNVWMVLHFVKGLEHSGSIAGTALSTASNFLCSAAYGHFLWKEAYPDTWWVGFVSVLVGAIILSTVPTNSRSTAESTRQVYRGQQRRWKPPPVVSAAASQSTSANGATAFSKYLAATQKKSPPPPPPITPTKPNFVAPSRIPFANRKRQQQQRKQLLLKSPIVDRWFPNRCPLCEVDMFDEKTGVSPIAVADFSPNCHHLGHSKCIKQHSTPNTDSPGRGSGSEKAGCPVCDKSINMWISAKQAAHFAGFWLDRVEKILRDIGPIPGERLKQGSLQPVPAKLVRQKLHQDPTLTADQKRYIDDDPTGLGKGLMASLEWGGYVDYNDRTKGRVGWSQFLRSRGLWKYTSKYDDIWLWEWGAVHPRQRCEGCQLVKSPLPIECPGCTGSSECAFYCSELCQKRDWQRHKMMCEAWQRCGPTSLRK